MADEVGFMMNPCVKRTWAPEAKTPVVPYRNRRQKKVSVIGAVALRHTAAAVAGAAAVASFDLVCDFHPDSYVRSEQAAAFLHRVLAEYKDVLRGSTWCGTTSRPTGAGSSRRWSRRTRG